MEIVKGILVVLHLVGFAAVFGSALAQMMQLKSTPARLSAGALHGSLLLVVTGLLLVGMVYMTGHSVNNTKIAVKTVVLLVLLVFVIVNRKKEFTSAGAVGTVLGLSLLNASLAVLWN